MKPTCDAIKLTLADALASDPPEIVTKAVDGIAALIGTAELDAIAAYIAATFYGFGMTGDEIVLWDAPHLSKVGYFQSEIDRLEREDKITFYRGWTLHTQAPDKPYINIRGPLIAPALALSNSERMIRIEGYLRTLVDDFRELRQLAADAVFQARQFSIALESVDAMGFEDAIDSYMSENHASILKVLALRIPQTLQALSRNYYYVPDHWIESRITIPYKVDTEARVITYSNDAYDEWALIETEIEKEIWRIQNQPGYLTTEAKLNLLKCDESVAGPMTALPKQNAASALAIVDDLVTLDQVVPLAGVSKRSLERHLKKGALPEPDVRGGGGKANKWFWGALREPLAKVANRVLPDRFPGSRIA